LSARGTTLKTPANTTIYGISSISDSSGKFSSAIENTREGSELKIEM